MRPGAEVTSGPVGSASPALACLQLGAGNKGIGRLCLGHPGKRGQREGGPGLEGTNEQNRLVSAPDAGSPTRGSLRRGKQRTPTRARGRARAQVPPGAGASDPRRALQRGVGRASGGHPGVWVWLCFGPLRPPVRAPLPGPSVSLRGPGLHPCWWLVCPRGLPTPVPGSRPLHTPASVPLPARWLLASGREAAGAPAAGPKLATHKAGVALSRPVPGAGHLSSRRGAVPEGRRDRPGLPGDRPGLPVARPCAPPGSVGPRCAASLASRPSSWPDTCSREGTGEFLSVYVVTKLPRWQTWVLQLHSVSEAN